MSNWSVRERPVINGTPPYDWNSASRYQCTWYAYWRVQEGSGLAQPPCWYSGSGSSGYGLYTNAKEWLNHYRDPWEVKDLDYQPSVGDVIVFTGGVGENQTGLRGDICNDLAFMGIELDEEANKVRGEERIITTPNSKIKVVVIPTDEEFMIASDTMNLI